MDVGPAWDRGAIWCFTYGCPTDELLAQFGEYTERGGLLWVIVPVHTPESRRADASWHSDLANT